MGYVHQSSRKSYDSLDKSNFFWGSKKLSQLTVCERVKPTLVPVMHLHWIAWVPSWKKYVVCYWIRKISFTITPTHSLLPLHMVKKIAVLIWQISPIHLLNIKPFMSGALIICRGFLRKYPNEIVKKRKMFFYERVEIRNCQSKSFKINRDLKIKFSNLRGIFSQLIFLYYKTSIFQPFLISIYVSVANEFSNFCEYLKRFL